MLFCPRWSRLRALVLPFVGVACSCLIVTAAPAPVERVTVKKADGTTVAGELISADHDAVFVTPAGKKDAVMVPWKDVASVSNGLTRGLAVNQWKAKRKGQLCNTCKGDRTVKHEACGGTGVDPAAKQPCAACKGAGTAGKCTNPKCKDGKVDCPAPCLKRSVGKWVVHQGIMSREVKVSSKMTYYIHEPHVGELFEVNKNGYVNKGDCPTCQRATKVDCNTCNGRASLPCKSCRGVGVTGPACKGCKEGQVACAPCKGSGLREKGSPGPEGNDE
jgi:hypothetical protein